MKKTFITLLAVVALATTGAHAQSTFQGILSGLNENPPNASPGTGVGTVVLNALQTQITVDLSWSGLLAAATVSHIHGPAAPTANAGVLFGFTGVPAATAGAIPTQVFAITPTQVAQLFAGQYYFNVHTSVFPGGEIRGQITQVPEPTSAALLVTGLSAVIWGWRRQKLN